MREDSVLKNLECLLTEKEVTDMGAEMAKNFVEEAEVLSAKKDSMSGFKSQIDDIRKRQGCLSNCITTGVEFRDVECQIEYDWENGMKSIIRLDTKAIVQKLEITEEEQQEHLNI